VVQVERREKIRFQK